MRTLTPLLALLALVAGALLVPASATPRTVDGGGSLEPAGWRLATAPGGTPHAAPSATGTGWSDVGDGVNQIVESLVVDPSGEVYAAGHFTEAGPVSTTPLYMVAKWDGATWTALGAANDWVFALALAPDGTLYAAGRFTMIGGVAASRVAVYDGTNWSALGTGFNNPPNALVVDSDGVLYAGGGMNVVGAGSARSVFRWDGTGWSVPGGGNGVDNTAYSLALDADDNLYVGGSFSSVSGVAAKGLARWDGASWNEVGGGLTQTGGEIVYALAFDAAGDLYAGGTFTEIGGVAASRVARWNGTDWSDVGGGVTGSTGGGTSVRDFAFDGGGNVYIGGSFTEAGGVTVNAVARWTGSAWEALDIGVKNGPVMALAISFPYLYAGGGYSSIGGTAGLNYLARWEGIIAVASEPDGTAPTEAILESAFPNPFRTETSVRFAVERVQAVRLELFDVLGRRVAVLYEGTAAAGQPVEARVDGQGLPAGVYVARLSGEGVQLTRRLTLVR